LKYNCCRKDVLMYVKVRKISNQKESF